MARRTAWNHPTTDHFHRGCDGKIRFPSKKNATARARAISVAFNAYRCPRCRRWHIGHTIRATA
ncbi:MAG: hypothetical protein ABL986_23440 [Vicinamibacterales bacterium]